MADEEAPETTDDAEEGGGKKKKLPMTAIVVAVVMVVEAVILGGAFMVLGGGPKGAQAEELAEDPDAQDEQFVELLLISDKFQNTRQGAQAYLYDATIYVVVREKNRGHMEGGGGEDDEGGEVGAIERLTARISEDVNQIFARAEPAQLNEPERQSLKRLIQAACDERFGKDADGDPYVVDVIISNWKRFSSDI